MLPSRFNAHALFFLWFRRSFVFCLVVFPTPPVVWTRPDPISKGSAVGAEFVSTSVSGLNRLEYTYLSWYLGGTRIQVLMLPWYITTYCAPMTGVSSLSSPPGGCVYVPSNVYQFYYPPDWSRLPGPSYYFQRERERENASHLLNQVEYVLQFIIHDKGGSTPSRLPFEKDKLLPTVLFFPAIS